MLEIYDNLFVGSLEDYRQYVAGRPDWSVVHAAKEPYHRKVVGYEGANPPRDHPEYFFARRADRLMLNVIDAPIDMEVPAVILDTTLAFIHERLSGGDHVMIHCEQGISRSAMIGMLFLVHHTQTFGGASRSETLRRYYEIYPNFHPGRAMLFTFKQTWAKYSRGLTE